MHSTRLGIGLILLAGFVTAAAARAVEVPPEGACPPYPVTPGPGEPPGDVDVVPPALVPGEVMDLDGAFRLRNYLPGEVWQRRRAFFYEGMQMEIGPCHRRYPAPPFFESATREHRGEARVDDEGNLHGYRGVGLPFAPERIADDDPNAGQQWAWNVRYRYLGAGFRGEFRILHLEKRGRKIGRFRGHMTYLPLHGTPNADSNGERFAWAGRFKAPEIARGVAWRQYRSARTDEEWRHPDELFVYVPEERRVRRAPPLGVDGLFVPSYSRGYVTGAGKLMLPDAQISTPDASIAVSEHWRRGFVGLMLRPNAYDFGLIGVRDVIAPINSRQPGFPGKPDRSYGPSGLSLATDRWEIRRAVVIEGRRKEDLGKLSRVKLFVDALTSQPLYLISRRSNDLIYEVGIFMGRYSGAETGAILPVAESFWVVADESWLRESFDLETEPLEGNERRDIIDSGTLQKEGR